METNPVEAPGHPQRAAALSGNRCWMAFLVVGLAFAVRVAMLDFKPAHFDEGVNGFFTDGMRAEGFYRYDPANYHGPLHFHVLFAAQQLFGRSLWVLRMPTALAGVATVALMLAFRRFLPWRTVWIAATAAAISPAMIFFSRYAIHEAWLPLFTLLATYGGFGIARGERHVKDLWAVGLGLAGMVLTKETYVLHWFAALLALGCGWLLHRAPAGVPVRRRPADLFGGGDRDAIEAPIAVAGTMARAQFKPADLARVTGVSIAIVITFYSGFFFNWEGAGAMLETFRPMFAKGTTSEEGHNKEVFYWLKLITWYEWPALAGLIAAPILGLRRSPFPAALLLIAGALLMAAGIFGSHPAPVGARVEDYLPPWPNLGAATSVGICCLVIGFCFFVAQPAADPAIRWLCLYGLGSLAAYSLIPYKTPWCIINILWPFFFILGHLGDLLLRNVARPPVILTGLLLAWTPLSDAWRLNFRNPVEDGKRYAYVQTTFDINNLLRPVRELVRRSPLHRQMRGVVLMESFPFRWELNDFPNVRFVEENDPLDEAEADFLLVPDHRANEIEERLLGMYFKERFHPRGGGADGWLYLNAVRFQQVLPGRTPEFHPRIPQPIPADPAPRLQP